MVFIVIITRLNHLPHPNYRPGTVKLSGTVKNAQGKTDASRDIVLDKGSITLDEVEVTASNVIVGDGNVTYIPTKKQVNGANTDTGLLFNMMIPQLNVNVMDNTVNTVDNSSLAIFVDGRQADTGELNRLRPKDIASIEY